MPVSGSPAMNRTVFILGAGASVEAGGPVMGNFIKKADDIRRRRAADDLPSFDLIFKAREKLQRVFVKSSLDLDNIEELYAAFEMAGLIGRLADLDPSEVSQLSLAMRRVITITLEQNIKFRLTPHGELLPPSTYDAFVKFLIHLLRDEQ